MRRTRETREELDRQQMALQQRQVAGHEQEQAFRQELATASFQEKLKLDAENMRRERDALNVKAFDDLNHTGSAFIPLSAAGDIGKFRESFNKTNSSITNPSE